MLLVNTTPPKGIYLVAIVFFASGLLCTAQLLQVVFEAFGLHGLSLANSKWILSGYVVALCLVLCGVALLARLHPLPRWLMFAMTLFFTIEAAAVPPVASPFYSASTMYFNRALLMLPLVASCVYLLTPGFRAACRASRGA
jgi:hypothetical protein